MANPVGGRTRRRVIAAHRAAGFALVAAFAALVGGPARADPETLSLGNASVTLDRGVLGAPTAGRFNSWWVVPEVPAGWGLEPDQYAVQASGNQLSIAFLPSPRETSPEMIRESSLRSWAGGFSSGSRFSVVLEADTFLNLPMSFEAAAGYQITGYEVALEGDFVREGTTLNGKLTLSGELGVNRAGGGHSTIAQFSLSDPNPGTDALRFESVLPATADFSTLAGAFTSSFLLDPPPADWPFGVTWGPTGEGRADFYFRTLEVAVLTALIPEPSSMLTLGAGLLALAGWSRRRSRR